MAAHPHVVQPTSPPPGRVEDGAHFYGEVRNRHDWEGTVMAEVVHKRDRHLPVHEHALPYFALIVGGNYEEEGRYGYDAYEPFSMMFNPICTRHTGTVLRGGVTFFTAEIGPKWLEPFPSKAFDITVSDTHGGELSWLAVRLFREHTERELQSSLTLESIVWEMLALTARLRDCEKQGKPRWWGRVRSYLHESFRDNLRISDLAAEAGVHPVYLARAFRKMTGHTPGEYLQGLRLQHVCRRLADPEKPLAEIALEAGFADQSHMTRACKRWTGTTPAALRKLLAPPSAVHSFISGPRQITARGV